MMINKFNYSIKENPLKTKSDVTNALLQILEPLESSFSEEHTGLKLDTGGTVYTERTREVESLLRPLWGIIPLLAGNQNYAYFDKYLEKIKGGTNPHSSNYWGEIRDFDQLMVEMAVLGVALCIIKERIWEPLTKEEQANLYNWLNQINDFDMPKTNWLFFRVLVNIGFKKCGLLYNQEKIDEGLQYIDSFYLDNGWYVDGYPNQIDYYIPFAIQYYSLIYVKVMEGEDQKYVPLFKERATQFAQTFRGFFDNDGSGVAYGRSMAYRFAQSAFWSALAFADVEALPWSEIKHLLLQNLRHWFKQDIFSASGELTVGYYYRNQIFAEGYNGYGSPYWALKSFLILAISDDHPFWLSEETVTDTPMKILLPEARMVVERDSEGKQVQIFTVGQHCEAHAHAESKYEKFVYSSAFGFSVPKGPLGLRQGAFDNTLAMSEQDDYYRSRYGVETYEIKDGYLYSEWKPWSDVLVKTYLIPFMPWHVRIHQIETKRKLSIADGGFAISFEDGEILTNSHGIANYSKLGISGIVDLMQNSKLEIIRTEPNTNLHYPETVIPTLVNDLGAGNHLIATAVLGDVTDKCKRLWENPPNIEVNHGKVKICYGKNNLDIEMRGGK